MSDVSILNLTALAAASLQSDDVLAIVDVHDNTQSPAGSTKKILLSSVFTNPTFITSATVTGDLAATTAVFGPSDPGQNRPLQVQGDGSGMAYFAGSLTNLANTDGLLVLTNTSATTNGAYDDFGISSQITAQTINTGVTDTGARVAITGDAYSALTAFRGTLSDQIGVRGRAGFANATAGARVLRARAGYFEIRSEAGGTGAQIDDAYGVYITNDSTAGATILRRWDLFAGSTLGMSYFAGKVGIGVDGSVGPAYKVDISTTANNDRGVNIANSGSGTGSIGLLSTVSGPATTNYGVRAVVSGGGTNYAFYADSGLSFFGDGASITGTLSLATAVSKIIPGATSLSLRNHADSADNLLIADGGAITTRTSLVVSTFLAVGGAAVSAGSNFINLPSGTASISHNGATFLQRTGTVTSLRAFSGGTLVLANSSGGAIATLDDGTSAATFAGALTVSTGATTLKDLSATLGQFSADSTTLVLNAPTTYTAIRFNQAGGGVGFVGVDKTQALCSTSTNGDMVVRSDVTGNVLFANSGTQTAKISSTGALTLAATITTVAPTGGAGVWKLGIANSVAPSSPNRTVTVEIGGTLYYLHAKTTND